MVIAVCSVALALSTRRERRVGRASARPARRRCARRGRGVPRRRARRARLWTPRPLPTRSLARFGELVAAAAAPIDDVRGTAAYRRHALARAGAPRARWAWARPAGARMRLTLTVNGEPREADGVLGGREPARRAARAARAARLARTPASRASAARARSTSTACWCAPAWCRRPGRGPRRRHGRGAAPTATSCTRSSRRSSTPAPCSAASARRAWSWRATTCCARDPRARATPRSARRWPATCAAAPATRRSSTRSGSRPTRLDGGRP